MLKKALVFVILLIIPAMSTAGIDNNTLPFNNFSITADFNKAGSAQKVIAYVNPDSSYRAVSEIISSANESIYLVSYRFWSLDIYNLIYNRLQEITTLKIRIVLENEDHNLYIANKCYTLKQKFGYDISVRIDTNSYYVHAKFIVVDNSTVFVSSENFIYASYPRDPDQPKVEWGYKPSRGWGIIILNNTIAQTYADFFQDIFNNAEDYDPSVFGAGTKTSYTYDSYSAPFENQVKVDNSANVTPFFSPINSNETILSVINSAKHFILLELAYINDASTTIQNLIDALKEAKDRGVTIHIILEDDKPFDSYFNDVYNDLLNLGFNVVPAFSNASTDDLFCHNKGIIVDGRLVIVGSINWSWSSINSNREAGVVVESYLIAKFYLDVYSWDWDHSSSEKFDSDGDGLSDVYEEEHGLDKTNPDMDGDGYSDYTEVIILGSDPKDPSDPRSADVRIVSPKNYSYIPSRSINIEWVTIGSVVEYYVYLNGSYLKTLSNDITSYSLYLQDEHWYIFTIIGKVDDELNISSTVIFAIDTTPPKLSLIKPYNSSTFTTNEIEIEWDVEDFSQVNFSVLVDNILVYNGTDTSCTVHLSVGQHIIVIQATDSAGNTASLTVLVKIKTPPSPPTSPQLDIKLIIMVIALVSIVLLVIIALRKR